MDRVYAKPWLCAGIPRFPNNKIQSQNIDYIQIVRNLDAAGKVWKYKGNDTDEGKHSKDLNTVMTPEGWRRDYNAELARKLMAMKAIVPLWYTMNFKNEMNPVDGYAGDQRGSVNVPGQRDVTARVARSTISNTEYRDCKV